MLMEKAESCCVFYVLTLKADNKGPELTHHKVDLVKLFLVFPKDTFWILFHSIYTYATCSRKAEIWILLVMLTTILHVSALKN